MAKKDCLQDYEGLIDYLESSQTKKWKKYHNNRTCFQAYCEIKNNLSPVIADVERGAMAKEVQVVLEEYKTCICNIAKEENAEQKIQDLLSRDPIIFLNNHGREHIDMVHQRAFEIIKHFFGQSLSEFEVFILVCAIEIHDIGNILGRANHEKELGRIFDDNCKLIIPDSAERRIIKTIAMAHGGKSIQGTKDTISSLNKVDLIFEERIRTQLLASIVRFADELADDFTRASRGALDLGIIGVNSKIYQDYSRVLHTVLIEEDDDQNDHKVHLVFELEISDLTEVYDYGKAKKYLLDEIYDRTLKMERERRYCLKFLNHSVIINKIMVEINIYNSLGQKYDSITYTLEDHLYPEAPESGSIKTIFGKSIKSGSEYAEEIKEREL